ncbi:hypothetical protein W97_04617 [Coniosporium apollinis CBS 100218]|uniref:Transcription initiation factor IIB n=1 Tax=Coniosporium apollinis (strain CBS 100218) TaxID=1168221 RepID=R7YU90_CONA1|nr:uncharacterized protein W97_04617 [Coniosporium apollinis CBS 100218]EON65379.1 hypothetical protein W97_04617 [Coniosporium apollinis CBS 100218]
MATDHTGRVLSPGEVIESPPESAAQEEEWQENLNRHLICPECKEFPPNHVDEPASGDVVCGSCGLVLMSHVVDMRSEWRTFANDDQGNDDPSRVGEAANPLLNGSQLQTSIAFGDGGSRSRDLHRAQNKVIHDKGNKSLQAAYKSISSLCDNADLPSTVADMAMHLFKQSQDAKILKGKSQDAIIASCIFIAARKMSVGRTFKDIYAVTKVSKKEIGRTFKILERFFATQTTKQKRTVQGGAVMPNEEYTRTTTTTPAEVAARVCNQLSLDKNTSMIVQKFCEKVRETGVLDGRSPLSTGSACVYFVSHLMGQGKSAKEIQMTNQVSDGTIRTAYKHLWEKRNDLVEPEWLERGGDMSRLPSAGN